jgi:hypothetical protein
MHAEITRHDLAWDVATKNKLAASSRADLSLVRLSGEALGKSRRGSRERKRAEPDLCLLNVTLFLWLVVQTQQTKMAVLLIAAVAVVLVLEFVDA